MSEPHLAPGLCPWLCLQGRAYQYGLETLRQQGVPVEGLTFDPELVSRGLIMDKDNGNLIKVGTVWGVGDLRRWAGIQQHNGSLETALAFTSWASC